MSQTWSRCIIVCPKKVGRVLPVWFQEYLSTSPPFPQVVLPGIEPENCKLLKSYRAKYWSTNLPTTIRTKQWQQMGQYG